MIQSWPSTSNVKWIEQTFPFSCIFSTDKQHRHDLYHHDHGDDDNDGNDVDCAALSYGRAAIQQLEQVKRAPFFCKIVFQYFCRLSRRCQSFTKNSLSILVKEAFLSYYKALTGSGTYSSHFDCIQQVLSELCLSLPGNWPEPESLQIHVRWHWTTNQSAVTFCSWRVCNCFLCHLLSTILLLLLSLAVTNLQSQKNLSSSMLLLCSIYDATALVTELRHWSQSSVNKRCLPAASMWRRKRRRLWCTQRCTNSGVILVQCLVQSAIGDNNDHHVFAVFVTIIVAPAAIINN